MLVHIAAEAQVLVLCTINTCADKSSNVSILPQSKSAMDFCQDLYVTESSPVLFKNFSSTEIRTICLSPNQEVLRITKLSH